MSTDWNAQSNYIWFRIDRPNFIKIDDPTSVTSPCKVTSPTEFVVRLETILDVYSLVHLWRNNSTTLPHYVRNEEYTLLTKIGGSSQNAYEATKERSIWLFFSLFLINENMIFWLVCFPGVLSFFIWAFRVASTTRSLYLV